MSDASDEKRKPPESVRLDIMFGSKGETWCASTGSMGINDGDIEDVEYVRADLVDPSDVPSDEWLKTAIGMAQICETDFAAFQRGELEHHDLQHSRGILLAHLRRRVQPAKDQDE
jgi:hypothetical protein